RLTMKRVALYSSSGRSRLKAQTGKLREPGGSHRSDQPAEPATSSSSSGARRLVVRRLLQRRESVAWAAGGALVAVLLFWGPGRMGPAPQRISQKDIDRAVLHSLETQSLPSPAAKAFETILPSVVRVRGFDTDPDGDDEIESNIGTGVVVVDRGLILTGTSPRPLWWG
ncbi:MAG: hypothetical protein MUC46_08710, partial [Desulfobacterales bacterium]|nr:hypothetical protein [Desulfobacterales bacterium]